MLLPNLGACARFVACLSGWLPKTLPVACREIANHYIWWGLGANRISTVRWSRAGSGKSGGVRVIYFTRTEAGEVVLLIMYAKSKLDTLKASTLKELRNAIEKSFQANDRR